MIFWHLITSIGNVIITIPITLTIAIWIIVGGDWKMSVLWCSLFAFAMTLVLITKIAFIGWGIGIESLNFTGFSGHATRAAMVFPVLFYYGLQRAPRKINSPALYLGVLIGLVISVSRVVVHAHSVSEALAGWLLGSAMAMIYLSSMQDHVILTSRRWLVACSFLLLFASPAVRPVQPEGVIVKVALYLSGHDRPFERRDWLRAAKVAHYS